MTRRVTATLALLLGVVNAAFAQSFPPQPSVHAAAGHAALAVHDPTTAIREFEQDASADSRAWLAVSLMMESRSPSDAYVQRAFEAAVAARSKDATKAPRLADLRAELRPDEVVVAFLVVAPYAYAWAIDREVVIGYPLPPVGQLATAATAAREYHERNDEAGMGRIGEEILPALLGPVSGRLPQLQRLVFVLDGPLQQLPIEALPADAASPPLSAIKATTTLSDYSQLVDALRKPPVRAPRPRGVRDGTRTLGAAVVAGMAIAAWIMLRRRRRA
jgi:hypothetical protein